MVKTPKRSNAPAFDTEAFARAIRAEFPALYLAIYHHRTHQNKRFDFTRFEYARDILKDQAQHVVLKKSTQGAATEIIICRELAWMEKGLSIIHVLPDENVRGRFKKNRFDMSVSFTAYYRDRMKSDVSRKFDVVNSYSVSLVHWSRGAVSFIGSHAVAGFGEFPADVKVIDEYNNCNQANLPMAQERLSNSDWRIEFDVSQPTISGIGISKLYGESDQKRWYLKCECGKWIRPQWVGSVVRQIEGNEYEVIDPEWNGYYGSDARMICDYCGRPVERFAPGIWVQENPRSNISGYHLSKLVSGKMTMNEMLKRFDDGLVNPVEAQRFWNADMGEDYTAPGAKVQEADLDACSKDYALPNGSTKPCFAGVDVGSVLHLVIGEMVDSVTTRLVYIGTLPCKLDLEDLYLVLRRFNIRMGVIDEKPETRLARHLAYRRRQWWMCRYAQGKRDIPDPKAKIISVDRTSSLDAVNEQFMLGTLHLPREARGTPDFYPQLTELTRTYNKDMNGGEGAYEWAGEGADHYFHALGYLLLARRMVMRK